MIKQVITIVREAGDILTKYHKSENLNIRIKEGNKHMTVTKADIEADKLIRKRLRRKFPLDSILSEESNSRITDYRERVWIVDPLDGTNHFIAGEDDFCIIVGLCINGKPLLGVIYLPIKDELYYAINGKGAYFQKGETVKRINVSGVKRLSESKAILAHSYEGNNGIDPLLNRLHVKEKLQRCCAGVAIMKVAKGEADFYVNSTFTSSTWDTCGAQIILEEAGGKLTDLRGISIDYITSHPRLMHSFMASNGAVHQALVEKFAIEARRTSKKLFKLEK